MIKLRVLFLVFGLLSAACSVADDVVSVTADEVARVWTGNAVAGKSRFGDRTLHITGVIESIDENWSGDPYVVLKAKGTFMGIWVYLSSRVDIDEVAALSKGQRVTLECDGLKDMMGLECTNGRIVPR